jgi:diacylglycerol O-acyltransferase-1
MATSTSTLTDTSVATAIDRSPKAPVHRGRPSEQTSEHRSNGTTQRMRTRDTKYRHVFATHSLQRTSCLSQDAESSPSFKGFRNLMVLVLREHSSKQQCMHTAND